MWFLWGSTFLAIRVSVQELPPLAVAAIRYLIAGLVLTPILIAFSPAALRTVTAAHWRSIVVNAVLLIAIGIGTLCVAETRIEAGMAALTGTCVPIMLALCSAFIERTPITRTIVLALMLGTLGIVVLTGGPGAHSPIGMVALMIVGGLAWATGSVLSHRDADLRSHPLIAGLEMLVGGAILTVAAALSGQLRPEMLQHASSSAWWGVVWLAGPGSIVGYTAYLYAVRTLPTSIVSTYAYVNPIVAVTLGVLMLGETLSFNIAVGGALLVAAVVAIVRSHARDAAVESV